MSPAPCDHRFVVPLFGLTPDGSEWSDEIVGWACENCWAQLFRGESLTWTAANNVTTYVAVSWALA